MGITCLKRNSRKTNLVHRQGLNKLILALKTDYYTKTLILTKS
jgi:hypothetical protein